ncbi:MAG TPA: branched-chain amino acid ABC transporter permease [Anaerolineae bacterium]
MQKAQTAPSTASWSLWLNRRRRGLAMPRLLAFLLLVTAVLPLFVQNDYVMNLLISILFAGAQAMAFDFTAGFINAVNFGFAAFVGIGAYTAAVLAVKLGMPPWIGIPAGVVMATLVGFITGILTLRQRGIYVSLMAWFVGLAMTAVVTAMVNVTRGSWGLNVPPLYPTITPRHYVYIMLVVVILLYILLRTIVRSHVGLAFRGIGQNFDAARASGINPTRYKVLNFTLSCACAGLIGGLYGHYLGILTPSLMGTTYTIEVLTLAYVGGRGTLWGGLLAAFLFRPVFDALNQFVEWRWIIYGIALIATMIFYPQGLIGLLTRIQTALAKFFKRS